MLWYEIQFNRHVLKQHDSVQLLLPLSDEC